MNKNKPKEININGKIYKLECVWNDDTHLEEGKNWSNKKEFIKYLSSIQIILDNNETYIYDETIKNNCLLCDAASITTKQYKFKKYIWEDGLVHYIKKHNIKPSEGFIDTIYNVNLSRVIKNNNIKLVGIVSAKNLKHIKVNSNQLLILDALMNHGGYKRKYLNSNSYKYSEHAGILDINNTTVDRIIVSADISRIDLDDDEIFMPNDISNIANYEYIFHTHPPTPKPGGRAKTGVLYEFPSFSDVLHFIDNFNDGKILGSLIVSPEGLYNIHTTYRNKNKLVVDENKFFKTWSNAFDNIQEKAIKKYGTDFSTEKFFSIIAQDFTFIDNFNNYLQNYNISIDFYPRINLNNMWIIDTIYLPIYS